MELNEILNPWIQQLTQAFQPYPGFVEQTTHQIAELEKLHAETVIALDEAHRKNQDLEMALASVKASAANRPAPAPVVETSSAQDDHTAELSQKISSLRAEIESLKAQLQSHLSEIQNKQLQLEAQRVQLEEQTTIRKSLQAKLEEVQVNAKHQDSGTQDLRMQIETLKAALAEARAQVSEAAHAPANERAPRASSPRPSQPKAPALPQKRVLLVDDAEINRVLMSHYFKGLPVKLDFAVSVSAAMEKCKEHRFDLIVVDDELQGFENTELSKTSITLVALSNKATENFEKRPGFQHILNRGQARESFIEQLKSFLWSA